jgi:hypothetical protein
MKRGSLISAGALVAFCAVVIVACSSSEEPNGDGSTLGDGIGNEKKSGGPGSFGADGVDGGNKGCTNLQCQQAQCSSGSATSVTGTVFAPNGTLPIYNAIVYVPNAAVSPQTKGATCDQCGTVASGAPVVTALSDSSGKFRLENVPVGKNIPLVIQLGKWRRQVVIPEVTKCAETKLTDPNVTRLPRNQGEGDMPKIAITTGGCDQLGCMLPKLGIDPKEFGVEGDGDAKAVHMYQGGVNPGGIFGLGRQSPPSLPPGATLARSLWSDINKLKKYDVSIFSCECTEASDTKDNLSFQAVSDYLAIGGRVFTTDFQYTWYRNSSNAGLKSISNITGGAPDAGRTMFLNDTFPKGKALATWLKGTFPASNYGEVQSDVVFDNFRNPVDATKAQTWATSNKGGTLGNTRVFTVNTPVEAKPEAQCGKAVHIDAHVNGKEDFPKICSSPLGQAEAMFAFFFFDLASCIQKDDAAPVPPVR